MEIIRPFGGLSVVQFEKTNFLLSGWICIVLGASISIAIPDALGVTISFPLGLCGLLLLIIGIRKNPEERVNVDEMRAWEPDEGPMREAGRVMYRVDTLLDPPIKSTIKCGSCGKVEWVEGGKPKSWECPHCGIQLWEEE